MTERLVATPVGDARVVLHPVTRPRATFVLSHGAGAGIDARDLRALREALPGRRVQVAAVEQPWRVAGKKIAPAPARLDAAWLAVLDSLAGATGRGPLVVAGRSAGARVACRTATRVGAAGVVALAFPLHPPGRPERSRADELLGAGVPTLVVQGERDAFGGPGEFPAEFLAAEAARMCPLPYADHGFAVPKSAPLTQGEVLERLVSAVADWLDDLLGAF